MNGAEQAKLDMKWFIEQCPNANMVLAAARQKIKETKRLDDTVPRIKAYIEAYESTMNILMSTIK
jgi:hypothetical protein